MRHLYNTTYFTANTLINGKPSRTKLTKHCSYCKREVQHDFEIDDRDEINYYFCTCDQANLEYEYKKKLIKIQAKYHESLLSLRRDISRDKILLKVNL